MQPFWITDSPVVSIIVNQLWHSAGGAIPTPQSNVRHNTNPKRQRLYAYIHVLTADLLQINNVVLVSQHQYSKNSVMSQQYTTRIHVAQEISKHLQQNTNTQILYKPMCNSWLRTSQKMSEKRVEGSSRAMLATARCSSFKMQQSGFALCYIVWLLTSKNTIDSISKINSFSYVADIVSVLPLSAG